MLSVAQRRRPSTGDVSLRCIVRSTEETAPLDGQGVPLFLKGCKQQLNENDTRSCGSLNKNGPHGLLGSGILGGVALLEEEACHRQVGCEVSEAQASPSGLFSLPSSR